MTCDACEAGSLFCKDGGHTCPQCAPPESVKEATAFLLSLIRDDSRNTAHRVEAARVLIDAHIRAGGTAL